LYNPPFDINTLAENTIKLLDDKTLAKRIGKNARKTVEDNFTLKIFANKTMDVYRKISNEFKYSHGH